MGSVSLKIGHGTARFHHATLYPSAIADVGDHKNLFVISEHISLILHEIEASKRQLHQIERELAGYKTLDPAKPGLQWELKLVLACHPLPLGLDSRSSITTMVSFVAHFCARPAAIALLSTFMSYRHAASCPTVDPLLLSNLISKACKPLPRCRRPPPPPSPLSLEPQCQEPPFGPCQASTWVVPCQLRLGPCHAGLDPWAKLFELGTAPFNGPCLVRSDTVAIGPCLA